MKAQYIKYKIKRIKFYLLMFYKFYRYYFSSPLKLINYTIIILISYSLLYKLILINIDSSYFMYALGDWFNNIVTSVIAAYIFYLMIDILPKYNEYLKSHFTINIIINNIDQCFKELLRLDNRFDDFVISCITSDVIADELAKKLESIDQINLNKEGERIYYILNEIKKSNYSFLPDNLKKELDKFVFNYLKTENFNITFYEDVINIDRKLHNFYY